MRTHAGCINTGSVDTGVSVGRKQSVEGPERMKLPGFWKALLVLFAVRNVRGLEGEIDENGITHVNEVWGLNVGQDIMTMQNAEFPNVAPANLLQTWRYVAFPDGALRVTCQNVSLPAFNDGSCGDGTLTIEDGGDSRVLCGNVGALNFLSRTKDIKMKLKTGRKGGGRIDCMVLARAMGPYGEVTDPPPTTSTNPPPTTLPPFMTMQSEEIDSSEFGGPPGRVGTSCPCGMANKQSTRVIGGVEAKVNEYPFAVILTYRSSYWALCGGSIITRRHVLTAAHCVVARESKDLAVGMGDHDFSKNLSPYRKVVNVTEIITHKTYWTHKNYDIALVVLQEVISFNKYIAPVCLPTKQLTLDWKYLTAMGWGKVGMNMNDVQSTYLRKANVRAVPLSLCALYTKAIASDPHQLCTYARKRRLAPGDSGSPIVWLDPDTNRYTIVGLTSFGDFNAPDVNADVSSFLPWIHQNIRLSDPSAKTCTSLN